MRELYEFLLSITAPDGVMHNRSFSRAIKEKLKVFKQHHGIAEQTK